METCAAVAYLTTAFEKDFYSLKGREFGLLVDKYIENPYADYHVCDEVLQGTCEEFRKTVWQLIDAKLIDASYRSYFYNYPKSSKLYTTDESRVINAILYGEQTPDLNEAVEKVFAAKSTAIADTFRKVDQLKIQLPDLIFDAELLYIETLRVFRPGLIRKLRTLDYSADGLEKTFQIYLKVLSYDQDRHCYSRDDAALFCELWEKELSETALLQWRKLLCRQFPSEILWYRSLFFGIHGLITKDESDVLSLSDAIEVTNFESKDFSASNAQYIQDRFARENDKVSVFNQARTFFAAALDVLEMENMAEILLDFMLSAGQIIPEFEKTVFPLVKDSSPGAEKLYRKYQALVSLSAESANLREQTLDYISELDRYDGYSEAVARQLYEADYMLDYILLSTAQGYTLSFEDERLEKGLNADFDYIQNHHPRLFSELRLRVVSTAEVSLARYSFLFGLDCPIMTQMELDAIRERGADSDTLIMTLIPQALVKEDHIKMLAEYFCRQLQNNKTSLEGKMAFMERTKYLDSQWEIELVDALSDDQDLNDRYIALVNQCTNIKNSTIQIICKLAVSPMSPVVNEKLYEAKKYTIYVSSKTAWEQCFTMETGDRGARLRGHRAHRYKRLNKWPSRI